jgi:hypothetical protein
MPLRIGFDLDGTLADFESAFHEIEVRLFGRDSHLDAGQPERESEEPSSSEAADEPRGRAGRKDRARPFLEGRRRRDEIWNEIRKTPNFWSTLKPHDPSAVRRIYHLALQHKWEVFFITQRPYTEGETVQRQTQRWLVQQGFDLPSVLVIGGSRGAAAAAIRLDYHVDDSAQNCLDVSVESGARPILLVPDNNEATITQARRLKIGTAPTIGAAIDVLDKATLARTQPTILDRIAAIVGWNGR